MGKKDEEVGKAVLSAVKQVAKEGATAEVVGAAKEVNDIIDQAIGLQQTVTITLFRREAFSGNDEFISNIADVQPSLIKSRGLEPIIQEWSGGGKYRGIIRGAGMPDKHFACNVAGPPQEPLPNRTNQGVGAGGLQNVQPINAPMNMGNGNFSAGPAFGGYLGLGGGMMGMGGMMGQQNHQMDSIVQMLGNQNNQMMAQLMGARQGGGDSDALQMEKEKTRQMQMDLAEERRRNDQEKADARHREEMAATNRRIEELAKANADKKEDPTVSMIKAIAPAAAIALPLFMSSKTEAASSQANMVKSMLDTNKEASSQSIGFMKMMMDRPQIEDRMAKQADTVSTLMANTMGLMGSFTSQMAQMQGGDAPPWLQVVNKFMEAATEIGSSMFAGGFEGQPEVPGQTQVIDSPGDTPPQLDAAAAAQQARAAMEASATADEGSESSEAGADGSIGSIETPDRKSYQPALQKIFDLIENKGNPHAIAFRIWKDGTSGDATSLAWFNNPEHYTFSLLGGFVDSGQMNITEERAVEIADALQEYHDHLHANGTPEAYRAKYDIRISMPKAMMVDPVGVANVDGKEQPLMGEAIKGGAVIDIENVEPVEGVEPMPKGPQNVAPPMQDEVVTIVPEGPQNAPPPNTKETVEAIKKIEEK